MKQVVKGQEKLFKTLQNLEKKVANQILRTELRSATKEIAAEIKTAAPVGETGQLKRAIRVRSAKKKKGRVAFNADIGAGAFKGATFYGSFVVLGTHHMPPNNFMADVFEKRAPGLAKEVPQRIWAAIKREAKG